MTKRILVGLAVVVGLVGLVALIGWMLPVGHRATRSALIDAPLTSVFDAVRQVDQYPSWRTGVAAVQVLPDDGRGRRFREDGSNGPIVFRIELSVAPSRFLTRIDDPDQPFGGTWTYELAAEGAGTRLTITEDGEVYNPIFRFLSRYVFSQTATTEQYLADAQKHLTPR
ncbi:MAG: hypothetical protein EXQ49_00825 [Acidobacteria bacterium]|nr:hypothetical protein [Acidobacteriota bacterium]